MEALAPFGDAPVVVKDFVKSRKHEWAEACFIPSAADREAVERVVGRFLELQGEDLAEGLVFREYVEFEPVGVHPRSGMPLTEEYRIFWLDGVPVFWSPYWDEGDYRGSEPPIERFAGVAAAVRSRFFTMDVARRRDGDWMIVELGDGQVSGLPRESDADRFYAALTTGLARQHEGDRAMIRSYRDGDDAEWLRMRRALWDDCPDDQQVREMEEILASDIESVFVAERPGGGLCGFLEAAIRPWADRCELDAGRLHRGLVRRCGREASGRRAGLGRGGRSVGSVEGMPPDGLRRRAMERRQPPGPRGARLRGDRPARALQEGPGTECRGNSRWGRRRIRRPGYDLLS